MFTRKKQKPPLSPVNRPGSLSIAGEFATVLCLVVGMSDDEAVLRLDRPRRLPSAFRLTIRGEARTRSCRVVATERQTVEVQFV